MMTLKERALMAIYQAYEQWNTLAVACERGCAACCTQNVMMTAVEGDIIYHFINEQNRQQWFAKRLSQERKTSKPKLTTNQVAQHYIQGQDVEEEIDNNQPCPFLDKDECSIYPVRPFACRCFASTARCKPGGSSELPTQIISAATATMQIIEHLGQREYWGNMLDVLLALADLPDNRQVLEALSDERLADYARARLHPAQPLPGLLIPPEDQEQVQTLLDTIFNSTIDGKRLEDILNGE